MHESQDGICGAARSLDQSLIKVIPTLTFKELLEHLFSRYYMLSDVCR